MTKTNYYLKTIDNSFLHNFKNITGVFNCPQIETFNKKELIKNDYMVLRYASMEFIQTNQSNILEFINPKQLYNEVESHASICDNSLYLNDFEGYLIDSEGDNFEDGIILKSIELDINNRIVACVYHEAIDDYKYYLID